MINIKDVKVKCNKHLSNLPIILTVEFTKSAIPVKIQWDSSIDFSVDPNPGRVSCFNTAFSICRFLARTATSANLYGSTALEKTEIDHWLEFCNRKYSIAEFQECLQKVERSLTSSTYLVGNILSLADIFVWSFLCNNNCWQKLLQDKKAPVNTLRWYLYLQSIDKFSVASDLPSESMSDCDIMSSKQGNEDVGKFVDLPGAEMGKVVVRFPPEASGFLHIGHAKAALLNAYYQVTFNGSLVMRFDDTNPDKEKEDYEKVILKDVEMLQIKPNRFTYTSDYFDLILEKCEHLLKAGLAFVDDTDAETMKKEREERIESKNRSNTVAVNLAIWEEMKQGTDNGKKYCVRAKIDMKSDNGCMRDPTLYRCKAMSHPHTGNKFNVYPTYDFACPIVDSIEDVTHALRTTEYHDRDEQYFWILDTLGMRKPYIYEYSRLNMTNTVLSKRKLTWFVDQGIVNSWEDPRMPTVQGILRRGMTVEGLKQFIIAQGSSRSIVVMEWDKIWAFNKKIIDPIAPRYSAVEIDSKVPVFVQNVESSSLEVSKHPKNSELGTKMIHVGGKLLIDYSDAELIKIGENVTFINWGNLLIKEIKKLSNGQIESILAEPNLSNKDFKKTLKITWVPDFEGVDLTPCACIYYDHLISKPILGKDEDFKDFLNDNTKITVMMIGDPDLKLLKKGDIIQIQRKGFFICDQPYDSSSLKFTSRASPVILISIPDGTKDLTTLPKTVRMLRTQKESCKEAANRKKGKSAEKSPMEENKEIVSSPSVNSADDLNNKITVQGDKIRALKAAKADKKDLTPEIELLLQLKKEFKNLTSREWKPTETAAKVNSPSSSEKVTQINQQIEHQGNKIRQMKADKVDKKELNPEIEILLQLKKEFKTLTGTEWKPVPQTTAPSQSATNKVTELNQQITQQGEKIRKLKSANTDKKELKPEIDILLQLKKEYKTLTSKEWCADSSAPSVIATPASTGDKRDELNQQITQQGEKIRQMKAEKANKDVLTPEINILLALKNNFKDLTGEDWQPKSDGGKPKQEKSKAKQRPEAKKIKEEKNSKEKKSESPSHESTKTTDNSNVQNEETENMLKKVTRLGMETKKEENLADWYSQVITKSEMIEYYDVSGCYILRPWAYSIWEEITKKFDSDIKALGVCNTYFPMFVSSNALEKEKTHIEDFAPEVAWVTKSGGSDLAEPIAIRPTSETVMYPSYAKWIRSHRDLPLKLNQWCNVVRWEFKNPQPFIRTREFLWQEGHTAFATREEAVEEVYNILDLYAQVYESLLAIPVVKGKKTEKEKFAGADFTTTLEAYIAANGRAVQGATSHHLGQNFSKMFEITFEDKEGNEKCFVHQNSWGLTTRTIGVMVMVHGDNMGLVLPPNVAMYQVVIVPCGITASLSDSDKNLLLDKCKELEDLLRKDSIRAKGDYRDNYSPGWKFNHWELKGVPLRVELGPRDLKKNQLVAVRRDNGEKIVIPLSNASKDVRQLLDAIQLSLYSKAKAQLDKHMVVATNFNDFCRHLDERCIILAPFCGDIPCEDKIKKDSARNADELLEPGAPSMGAKSLCIPFNQPQEITSSMKCINPSCSNKPQYFTLFGRSY